jgi:hypothetical protein
MPNPTIRIHNTETDEIIDREMTKAEFDQYKKDVAATEASKAAELAKIEAKAALLAKLGITAEEAQLLLS